MSPPCQARYSFAAMRIVLAGGTGFLGAALADALVADGDDVVVLTRDPARQASPDRRQRLVRWEPNGEAGAWAREVSGAGVVVNLAGEPIAGTRWSAAHKRRILESRVNATRSIVAAIRAADSPPVLLVSGSAVGYYGPRADEIATEETPAGAAFLASVCEPREAADARAANSL